MDRNNKPFVLKCKIITCEILILVIVFASSCRMQRSGGTIPVYMDDFVSTTEERRFQLVKELEGQIIDFQKSYPCDNDSILYNATAIVNINSNIFTIYNPCLQEDIGVGEMVMIKPIVQEDKRYTTREIYKAFSKSSANYPYWECISCKYKNAFGEIQKVR